MILVSRFLGTLMSRAGAVLFFNILTRKKCNFEFFKEFVFYERSAPNQQKNFNDFIFQIL